METIYALIVEYLKRGLSDNLIAVALFGSYARGDQNSNSDVDILVIANDLPENHFTRMISLNSLMPLTLAGKVGFTALTPDEWTSSFPSYYLDLGLDAKILFDPVDFLVPKLQRIREIIKEAGLSRVRIERGFAWCWKNAPKPGKWEIHWEGYHERG